MFSKFAVLLSLVFLLQVAAGITGFVLYDQTHGLLDTKMNHTMYKYGHFEKYQGSKITALWDFVQDDVSAYEFS